MKTIYLLQVDDKVIGKYTSRSQAYVSIDAYFEAYGVKPTLIVTKRIGFIAR